MAKEAIEKVRNAEEEALRIVAEAEQKAAALLSAAGEKASNRLEEIKAEEEIATNEALRSAKEKADGDFVKFKEEVSEKCETYRKEILANSEQIIGRIIDAVRKG